jgi:hypothetical protein
VAQSIEQLVFELTVSALAEQERAVADMRARASTALGAASVAGSFLGANAIHDSLDAWGILALSSFGLCVASAIWVLRPHDLVFAFRGGTLLRVSDSDRRHDVREAYRAASVWIEAHRDRNASKVADLSMWLTASCLALAVEIVLWTISLIE